jgi:methionine sulfoxide reductase heme-binding subunit
MQRLLLHHMPLALGSATLLALFMALPAFDTTAYPHVDVMSGPLPRPPAAREPTIRAASHGAESMVGAHEGHHGGTHARSARHATEDAAMGGRASTRPAAAEHSEAVRSRTVQQLTVASGYLAVVLLAVTLLLGPANLVLRRRNPISTYLRRDVGIWTAAFSVVHVISAAMIHVSHGSGLGAAVLHFFVAEDGTLLTNSFGLGNWTGIAAVAIVLVLLATSSDVALKMLKAKPWKWLQRLTYAVFALVILHAFFYGALLRMNSPFTRLLILSVILVAVGQGLGVWLWRRRNLATKTTA